MNTKILHLLYAVALFPSAAGAQEIDADTARSLARQFFTTKDKAAGHRARHNAPAANVDPVLAYTASTNGIPDFYVFNRSAEGRGFVIINAHGDADATTLGYSDAATFDFDALPPNLRWWLELYQTNGLAKIPHRADAARHDIAPLVSTKWGQNEPYNSAIPCQAGYKPFPTGCVATAMAQIMKYWNYPTHGQGSNSYSRTYNGGEFTLDFEADFGSTTYDWANMLDTYDSHSTATQQHAAALLAYHAGVSVGMKYAGTSSSSDSRDAAGALARNFCYDHSVMVGQRNYFSDADWAQTIYDELSHGRPVLYAGSTPAGAGHAFVCHGYDATNQLYAINWGWNGNYDGYFALAGPDALTPHGTSTGGGSADEGYTDNQRIIYNIFPDEGGAPVLQIGTYADFTTALNSSGTNTFEHLDIDRSQPNADVRIYYNYSPFNYGAPTVDGNYGVIMRNVVNGAVYHNTPQYSYSLESHHYVSTSTFYNFSTSIIPCNGTYELLPAFTTNDDPQTWHTIATPGHQPIPTITITGGEAPDPVALPITLGETTIQVGKTATIALSPYYTGDVNFTSANSEVATVDADGVITALQLGSTTITVSAAGDEAFLPTETQFSVSVVEHVVRPYDMKVGKTELLVGETTNIVCGGGYNGQYTYLHSPSGIVVTEPDGTIRALTNGKTTIYATTVGADYDHPQTTSAFTFNVKSSIRTANGLGFTAYPYIGTDNVLSASNSIIKLPIANTSSDATLTPARVYYSISSNKGVLKGYTGYQSLKPGQGGTAGIDLTNFTSYFTPGKGYDVYFFSDEARQKSLNIPSMVFYMGKPTTITLDVTEGICTTLSLPFAASIPAGLEAYELDAYYDNTFHLSRVSSLESGHSYIVAGASGKYQFTGDAAPCSANPSWRFMTGHHYDTYVPAGSYLLTGNNANTLVRTKAASSAPLWMAHVNLPSVSDDLLSLSQFTDASLITGVGAPLVPSSSAIFSLDGRPLPSLRPGINIIRTPDGTVRKVEVR